MQTTVFQTQYTQDSILLHTEEGSTFLRNVRKFCHNLNLHAVKTSHPTHSAHLASFPLSSFILPHSIISFFSNFLSFPFCFLLCPIFAYFPTLFPPVLAFLSLSLFISSFFRFHIKFFRCLYLIITSFSYFSFPHSLSFTIFLSSSLPSFILLNQMLPKTLFCFQEFFLQAYLMRGASKVNI
jgi:hypothetical protein